MLALYVGIILFTSSLVQGGNIYVDTGNPYDVGKLETGELTLTVTTDNSPKHSKVYFPLEPGEYATVYFVGGLNTIVLAEYYSIVLRKIAEHGFFVFGIDYDFPVQEKYGQDVNIYFEQLEFFKKFVKTVSTPRYDRMGLLCHSSGCDITLKMIQDGRVKFNATSFLEPVSMLVREQLKVNDVPGFMYGAELAEKGVVPCNIPGIDYKQFYSVWKCPRIVIEVAAYGHCAFLDPVPYNVCRTTHFCTTGGHNTTELNHYRETVQGVVSSFFMTMLQGRPDAISYISDEAKVPMKLLIDKSDLNCMWRK